MENILITKKSGDQVLYDPEKLKNSLLRAGASVHIAEKVLLQLDGHIHNGMSTHKVYQKAYALLSKISHGSAGRYRLKKAIMELGPTGYPFENFIGAIIEHQGFEVSTGQIIEGLCVDHEVDVVAENKEKIIIVECKFHREGNRKSDVKIPLYIRSRFNDIYAKWEKEGRIGNRKFEGWLVTNTRFTEDAEKYGKCSGLKLISWDYPKDNSLRNLIDLSGLHPITSLKTLTQKEKQALVEKSLVLCKEISEEHLVSCNIPKHKFNKILREARSLTE